MKVAVIFGGPSSEHEVSLASAKNVLSALLSNQHDVFPIGVLKDGRWVSGVNSLHYLISIADKSILPAGLEEFHDEFITSLGGSSLEEGIETTVSALPAQSIFEGVDVVFPVLHGAFGEDGKLQGLLEISGVPYVGCGVLSSAACMDKIVTKQVLESCGVKQASWFWLDSKIISAQLDSCIEDINSKLGGFPVFVKPANAGSSVGISKVKSAESLKDALIEASKHDSRILLEESIEGRELEVAVLGNSDLEVSPIAAEVLPEHEFYDYKAKYIDGSTTIKLPADLPNEIMARLQSVAKEVFVALDCAGLSRVDFFYRESDDSVILNEINTLPGFTQISQYPKLMMQAGYTYEELIQKLIDLAIEKHS